MQKYLPSAGQVCMGDLRADRARLPARVPTSGSLPILENQ